MPRQCWLVLRNPFDKLVFACRADQVPVYTLNVSDSAAEVNNSSRCRHVFEGLSIRISYSLFPTVITTASQATAGVYMANVSLLCRRLLANIDTVRVDVWLTVLPAGNVTAWTAWKQLSPPDARLWETTKQWGYPMNLTFLNATTYKVCKSASLKISGSISGRATLLKIYRADACIGQGFRQALALRK